MPKSGEKTKREAQGAATVGKALDVLEAVAEIGRPVRFVELEAKSGLPKGTLYRFLQSLTMQGMLSYEPERRVYFLGMRLVRLAHAAWKQSSLAPVARVHLDALAGLVPQTIHLAQLDGGHVLYVDKLYPSRPVEMFSSAGKVGPAYCTGIGKAMLAHLAAGPLERALRQQSFYRFTEHTLTCETALLADLATIRDRGFALDNEEHESGIICVAVPVLSEREHLLGGLSVTAILGRTDLDELIKLVPNLQETAARIAADAENWRFPETNETLGPMGR